MREEDRTKRRRRDKEGGLKERMGGEKGEGKWEGGGGREEEGKEGEDEGRRRSQYKRDEGCKQLHSLTSHKAGKAGPGSYQRLHASSCPCPSCRHR